MSIRLAMAVGALAAAEVLGVAGCDSAPGKTGSESSVQAAADIPAVETVRVAVRPVDFVVSLPGELRPYQAVSVYPKVTGLVKSISVDRGSRIAQGQVLADLEAPEIVAQEAEAEAKLASAENQ
ncbi:MAG: biotin/lipoyl-binding protein, partial [Steroidobacteraceae bacterium]